MLGRSLTQLHLLGAAKYRGIEIYGPENDQSQVYKGFLLAMVEWVTDYCSICSQYESTIYPVLDVLVNPILTLDPCSTQVGFPTCQWYGILKLFAHFKEKQLGWKKRWITIFPLGITIHKPLIFAGQLGHSPPWLHGSSAEDRQGWNDHCLLGSWRWLRRIAPGPAKQGRPPGASGPPKQQEGDTYDDTYDDIYDSYDTPILESDGFPIFLGSHEFGESNAFLWVSSYISCLLCGSQLPHCYHNVTTPPVTAVCPWMSGIQPYLTYGDFMIFSTSAVINNNLSLSLSLSLSLDTYVYFYIYNYYIYIYMCTLLGC